MKRIITTLISAAIALAGTSAMAQNVVVEAGFGLSSTSFKALDYKVANADLFGGTLGVSYQMPMGETGLRFAPGVRFGYFTKGGIDAFGLTEVSLTETYLEVPLDFNYAFPVSDDMKLVVMAGPTLDVGLTSRIKEKSTGMEYDIYSGSLKDYTKYSRFDLLLGGGLAFDVMDVVRFSVRYDYGVLNRNAGNLTSGLVKVHRGQLKIGVGLLF